VKLNFSLVTFTILYVTSLNALAYDPLKACLKENSICLPVQAQDLTIYPQWEENSLNKTLTSKINLHVSGEVLCQNCRKHIHECNKDRTNLYSQNLNFISTINIEEKHKLNISKAFFEVIIERHLLDTKSPQSIS
jgi:hypothetical protein